MKKEIWKDVVGYEGYYKVNNIGNIKSLERTIIRRDGVCRLYKESKKRSYIGYKGYVICGFNKGGQKVNKKIHRVVAKAFIPNPEKKLQVNHIDGNKSNNCVSNLEWCTNAENMAHAVEIGLTKGCTLSGEDCNLTTTKKTDVLAMRKEYKKGCYTYQDIAKKFNVGNSCAYHILTRRSWKHI